MARITDEELERIKQGMSLRHLVQAHGVELKPQGADFVGRCPFHDDSTASFTVSTSKNLFHCFGCGAAGSVIDWAMRTGKLPFRRAVAVLRKHVDMTTPLAPGALPPVVNARADDQQLLDDVAAFYHATLKESPEALAYLATRGISLEAADAFKIGFVNRTLSYGLPDRGTASGAGLRERLQRVGIVRETGHELMRGSITVPIMDVHGHVRGMYGRKVSNGQRPGTPLHLYLPGKHQGVFNVGAFAQSPELILCESLIDALTFWSAGIKNVTTAYGVEGFTTEMVETMRHYGIKRVFIAFDRDAAGDGGAEKVAATLIAEGMECLRVKFPHGLDANEYALKVKPAAQSLRLAVNAAEWMGTGLPVDDAAESQAPALPAAVAAHDSIPLEPVVLEVPPPLSDPESSAAGGAVAAPVSIPLEPVVLEVPPPLAPTGDAVAAPASIPLEDVVATSPRPSPPAIAAPGSIPLADVVATSPRPLSPAIAAPESIPSEIAVAISPRPAEPFDDPPSSKAAVDVASSEPRAAAIPSAAAAAPIQGPGALMTTETITPEVLDAEEHHFQMGGRKYRVRGLKGNSSLMVMKVNITVRSGGAFYVDTLDVLTARARAHFIKMVSVELCMDEVAVKADVGEVLDRLEHILEARLKRLLEPQAPKTVTMTAEEQQAAMTFLKDPQLMTRIVDDLGKVGIVGEKTNKQWGYLAAVSRKLRRPLAIIIQSVSGAGKSSLMDAVLSLMPEEEVIKYSAMTSQALYYMGETNLKNKILALAEEEGAEKASYALKLLQSEGELTIASTGKDPQSGRHETKEYHVEGPVMVFVTTTSAEPDEEFLNRCVVLTVDESREQTRAIHEAQRMGLTREGIVQRSERALVTTFHRNAQRLLRPLAVLNPYAAHLKFPDHRTRTRRDFPKYTALIESITLLFQHQRDVREVQTEHGEVLEAVVSTLEDVALANELAAQVLGQTLDELQPQTRRLLMLIGETIQKLGEKEGKTREELRLTQREIRDYTGWGNTQLKVHLARLAERELVILHRAGVGHRYLYELAYDGQGLDGKPFVVGLADVAAMVRAGAGRGDVGGVSGGGRDGETARDGAEKPTKKTT